MKNYMDRQVTPIKPLELHKETWMTISKMNDSINGASSLAGVISDRDALQMNIGHWADEKWKTKRIKWRGKPDFLAEKKN